MENHPLTNQRTTSATLSGTHDLLIRIFRFSQEHRASTICYQNGNLQLRRTVHCCKVAQSLILVSENSYLRIAIKFHERQVRRSHFFPLGREGRSCVWTSRHARGVSDDLDSVEVARLLTATSSALLRQPQPARW